MSILIPIAVTLVCLTMTTVLAFAGGVRVGKQHILPPGLGMVVAPVLLVGIGSIFLLVGLVFTAPLWTWWLYFVS